MAVTRALRLAAGFILKIGKRQGQFPGMLANRTLRIVVVKPDQGVDVASSSVVDKVVAYGGKATSVQF